MLRMEELHFLHYMILPAEWHCPLSDYFMRMVEAGAGRAYQLSADGTPVSFAIVLREGVGWRMPYLFTHPEQRRKGYARQLICQMVEQLDGYLRAHIIQTHPYYDALLTGLQSLGFVVNDTSCVYSVEVDERFWARMDELKLTRMKEFLLRGGLACTSLRAAREEGRQQLMDSPHSCFENQLDPAEFLRNPAAPVDKDLSMLLTKDGQLLAYTLILRPSIGVAQIEHIAEAKEEIGGGKIVAPLCATLEAMRNDPQIQKMKLTISDGNLPSYRFVMEILKGLPIHETQNVSLAITAAMLKNYPAQAASTLHNTLTDSIRR
ncbi:MAG: GNAT family N-acetyltransferase [Faecalibacterium sp.]